MIFKLRTSKKTAVIFEDIHASQGLQPFILSKLAIALSIRQGKFSESDFGTDTNGLELSRQTIFGEHDMLFKCLAINNENKNLDEDEYFPKIVKAHLDRGAILLENEWRYSKDFYNNLCRLGEGI